VLADAWYDATRGAANFCAALQTIIRVADAGGGKVIVVNADNPGLRGFYTRR